MSDRFAHCGFCGAAFARDAEWPRLCAACRNTSYRNPIPVAVLLLPVGEGLLVIRRAVPPQVGKLALPGGYVSFGETWQQAAARELHEETGITVDADGIRELRVTSAPDGTVLLFGVAAPMDAETLPAFVATDETSERTVIDAPAPMAFPLHEDVVREWFATGKPANRRSRTR